MAVSLVMGLDISVMAEPEPSKAVLPAKGQGSTMTLNLKGADLETLVETVAKATGKNFVLDAKVQGKVTVVSHKPVSGDELYAMFLSILEVHGFMAVPVGNVIKIIPDNDLKYQAETSMLPSGGSDEVVAQIYRLRYVDAGRIIPVLRPMLGPKAHLSAHPDTNSLVISGRSAEIARLEKLLERVDRPFTETIETVPLEHAKVADVMRIATELNKILAPDNSEEKVILMADERTNAILLGGSQNARLRMRMLIGKLDGAVEVSGNTRVINLKYAKAEELAKVLANMGENYLKENKQENAKGSSLVNVQAYTGDNSLVISAPSDLLRSMTEVVRVLDRRRKQVQVKAIIAEVSNDKIAELGVQWGIETGGRNNVAIGVNFPSANPSLSQFGIASENPNAVESASVLNNVAGLMVGGADWSNLAVLLRALKSDVDTNILSTPSIVTLDNEEAEIVVGQEVPFITTTSTNNAGNPFQTITRENVGISLKVKPQITDGETIRMDIEQEVSSLDPNVKDLSDAVTKTRRIKTSVLVEDQQILVLGGLIQDKIEQTTAKVPFLGDIPLLGVVFRSERSANDKTNLMVFLRPQVLHDRHAGEQITGESYNIIRQLQLDLPEIQGPVRLEEKPPLLSDWNDQLRMSQRVDVKEIVQEDLAPPFTAPEPAVLGSSKVEPPAPTNTVKQTVPPVAAEKPVAGKMNPSISDPSTGRNSVSAGVLGKESVPERAVDQWTSTGHGERRGVSFTTGQGVQFFSEPQASAVPVAESRRVAPSELRVPEFKSTIAVPAAPAPVVTTEGPKGRIYKESLDYGD
ncbi:MAG: type II secretion system secretin GspD [Magnetococcales bacterium]|nr:type II secretion system secretin GspD [Magnetococcales bacterium]